MVFIDLFMIPVYEKISMIFEEEVSVKAYPGDIFYWIFRVGNDTIMCCAYCILEVVI